MNIPRVPLIYVAGPYSGKTHLDVKRNIRAAQEVGVGVLNLGGFPVIPHANTEYMDGAYPEKVFLDGDLVMLSRCDAMTLVPGWQTSSGTKAEIDFAIQHDIPVFDDDNIALADWIEEYKR